uniref:Amino acid permease n=1 Tax=Heterorhabditis bacteriophora TaxID=37862 RepID=A0A1I7W8B1_HETBA
MPLSLLSGIIVVSAIYIAINLSYFVVLSPEEMRGSTAVAATLSNNETRTLDVHFITDWFVM